MVKDDLHFVPLCRAKIAYFCIVMPCSSIGLHHLLYMRFAPQVFFGALLNAFFIVLIVLSISQFDALFGSFTGRTT